MSTPVDLAHPPSSHRPVLLDVEGGLAELMDLFAVDDAVTTSRRPSLRASGVRVLGWAQDSSRRAAGWGAVPATARVQADRVAIEVAP